MTAADTHRLSSTYRLWSRYTDDDGTVFMTGLQALARLPIEQLRADRLAGKSTAAFISGYPGSPLGGFDGEVARALAQVDDLPIVFKPAINEEQAATAVMGSQLTSIRPDPRHDGVVGIMYGKAPGIDRASDAIRHGVFAGSDPHGGAVVIAGDDPAAKSSTIPSSSAGTLADMRVPVLYPGTPAEALELGRHAVYLSRATGLWTGLKIVADVADGSDTVHLDPTSVCPKIPRVDGEPYRHKPDGRLLTPATVDTEREIYEVRHPLAISYAALNGLNHAIVNPADAWIGIIASGITYREVREALRRLGLGRDSELAAAGVRVMRMQMPIPFSAERARIFARGLDEVFVIEEKHPNIELLIKEALYHAPMRPRVTGKFDEYDSMLLPGHSGLSADTLLDPLRRRLAQRIGDRLAPPQQKRELIPVNTKIARTPYFCSGCPHNRATRVPEGAAVGAGIGCHTMTLLMESEDFGDIIGLTCMGQEGTQWVGMAPFVETPHIFQNLGDGTYFHSGQMAIQGAIAAGVDITYKLLWNRTVAMTGGQDPQGLIGVPELTRVLLAQGVARVLITTEDLSRYRGEDLPNEVDVWPRRRLLEAQEVLAETSGVTVLIHDQQCAAEARRGRKRGTVATPRERVVINHRVCEGCGDCASISNCLSVQPVDTPFGRKTRIDQTSCNLDFSCLEGDCPSFLTIKTPGRLSSFLRRLRTRLRGLTTKASAKEQSAGGSAASSASAKALASPVPKAPEPSELAEPVAVVPVDDLSLRMIGIGGTGVVTVGQIVGTAAMFDGYEVRGLDQIGLSQKAGPVVSDLRLTRDVEAATNRLGSGQADVLLAFDQLGAASPTGLGSCDPQRTVVVGSTSATPTGAVVSNPERAMPDPGDLEAAIAAATRDDCRLWADAQHITSVLLGNTVTANIFVTGMAVQAGALPVAPESMEQAIELNGVAVTANIAAFRWGRALVTQPETVRNAIAEATADDDPLAGVDDDVADRVRTLAASVRTAGLGDLNDTSADGSDAQGYEGWNIENAVRELCDYQSPRLAHKYLDLIEAVTKADSTAGDGSGRLTRACARGYFKLLAYKDEYEVARLMLDADAGAEAREMAAEVGGRVSWKLHPPLLRAIGLSRKISVPTGFTPLLRMLAAMKSLRGTPLDVFGYTVVRRAERSLPREYRSAIEADLKHLGASNYTTALDRALLPELVRGYEEIKMEGIAKMRAGLSGDWSTASPDPQQALIQRKS